MALPSDISTRIANLQAQTAAAAPLQTAAAATLTAIKLTAAGLVTDLDARTLATAGALDTWSAPTDPLAISTGVLGLLSSAEDQSDLANARGFIGRATSNINQVA